MTSVRSVKFKRRTRFAALALGGALALAACSGPQGDQPAATNSGGNAAQQQPSGGSLRVAVVTHGSAGDAFWNVVKNGAEAAGKQLGAQVDYKSDGDPGAQAKLIDNAVAQKVDGLVVSMANPDALQTSIENAVKAGIPVVTINSGDAKSAQFGAIAHVGQTETVAGEGAGKRLKDAGKTKLLCVIHEAGNIGQNERCDGAKSAFGDVQTLQVDINNPTDAQARIKGAVQTDPSVDAVLALNSQVAAGAVQDLIRRGSVHAFKRGCDTRIFDLKIVDVVDRERFVLAAKCAR